MYHPGKANTVADALSRKSSANLSCLLSNRKELLTDLEQDRLLIAITAQPTILDEIKQKQCEDEYLKKITEEFDSKPRPGFMVEKDVLKFQNRLCVPDYHDLRKRVMTKAHSSKFAMHPGNTKMYHNLKQNFWWPGMKKIIADFVARCLQCQQVKAEHQRPAGLLQPLPIPEWKWEHITMDFIVGLPRSSRGMDSIWVIVDRLTKSAHFLPVKLFITLINWPISI